jgi:uncharacterized protein (TIGR01777 family)
MISASGAGFYGDRGHLEVGEECGPGEGFLAEVCVAWEEAAQAAKDAGVRVCHPRFGVVLSTQGGALSKMVLPFKLGLGGRIGSGEQYFPWVSLPDAIGALRLLLSSDDLEGPVNIVSPEEVTNAEFADVLGDVLGRPTFIPLPAFALRLGLGSEMAEQLLLQGQRVVPRRLRLAGFTWEHEDLRDALQSIL